MKNLDTIKLIGLAGMALAGLASLISDYAQNQQMERMIDEKVNEALAKREEDNEGESV